MTSAGVTDSTFGDTGVASTPMGGNDAVPAGVARQSTGAFLACGQHLDGGSVQVSVVARFTSKGTLDTTFGASGLATLNGLAARAIAVGPEDSFAGGKAVARFAANGTLDTTFGTDGERTSRALAASSKPSRSAPQASPT